MTVVRTEYLTSPVMTIFAHGPSSVSALVASTPAYRLPGLGGFAGVREGGNCSFSSFSGFEDPCLSVLPISLAPLFVVTSR